MREPQHLADFRALSYQAQEWHLRELAGACISGAPVSLARKLEIFLDNPERPA